MSYFSLLMASLFRRKTRTALTLLSITVAFLLFALLRSVVTSLNADYSGANRLVTAPRYSIVDPLPISHLQRIKSVPGVLDVTHTDWFGGKYKDPANFFPKYPVIPREYFAMYPEYLMPRAQLDAFERTRTAVVAARDVADKYGWKIGDKIPIEADIWPKKTGDRLWSFDLVGIFDVKPGEAQSGFLLINYDYFDEARQFAQGTVGNFVVRIADPLNAATISHAIDKLFANSANETRTSTEKEYQASFVKQFGDIEFIMTSILSAVFFTILLLTGNTMAQAFRERIPEVAVLKTLGFGNVAILGLILGEAVLLALVACVAGMLLARLLLLAPFVSGVLGNFVPDFSIAPVTIAVALLLAVLLGFITGIVPAVQGMRLTIVEALQRG